MGSSGSGKTTFLSALSKRLDMKVTGQLHLNGVNYTRHDLKSMSGYVMQDDLLCANFTVEETLSYTSHLRMPANSTAAERKIREQYVMKLMGIYNCRNVPVGDTRNKGISGGERKRLCIAMELLMKPSLLFLDEPTSGLDSATALSVLATLKQLSARGECTVVSTIHQPQSKIYSLFDNLILMRKGHMVYQGAADKALLFFESCGFPCPPLTNPADHIISVLSQTPPERQRSDSGEASTDIESAGMEMVSAALPADESEGSDRYEAVSSYESGPDKAVTEFACGGDSEVATQEYFHRRDFLVPVDLKIGADKPAFRAYQRQPWYAQFAILFRRSLHSHMRRWDVLAMNLLVTVLIAVFTCMSVWEDIGTHKLSGSKRQAALFFCVIHQGIVASLQGSHSFPLERALMLRERAAGSYQVSAYFVAKTVADMSVQLVSPVIFTIIVYPVIGFAPTASQFFLFMMFMVLDSSAATSLTSMISCLCVGIELSTVVAAGAYEISRLYGGWFISPAQISLYPDWRFADALSYIKYAFVGVSLNENRNLLLTCLPSEMTNSVVAGVTVSKCVIAPLNKAPYSGAAYNEYYGYDEYTIGYCAGLLVVFIVGCRVVAYLGLRFIKV